MNNEYGTYDMSNMEEESGILIHCYYAKSNPFLRLECPGTTGKVKQTNKQTNKSCGVVVMRWWVKWCGLVEGGVV